MCEGTIQQLHNLRAESHLEQRNDCSFRHVWEGAIQQFHKLWADSHLEQGNDCSLSMSGRVQYNKLASWRPKAWGPTPCVIHPWNRGTELGMGHALLHL